MDFLTFRPLKKIEFHLKDMAELPERHPEVAR